MEDGTHERGQHPVYAFNSGASGDIGGGESHKGEPSSEFIQWHFEGGGAEITSPLVYGGYFYTLHDRGYMGCNDATTGEVVYEGRRLRGKFMASPWAYNDQIFCLDRRGKTFVIKPGPDFEVVRENDLKETCIATPAVAQGKLFIRTESKLYCISGSSQ